MSVLPHPIIERIRVKNYRSLADVDVQLSPLTVLVGTNGSGKSNVIDALRFVRDAIVRGLDAAVLDRGGMSAIRRWSPKGAPYDVTIHLYLRGSNWSGEYAFTLGSERRGEYHVKWERLVFLRDEASWKKDDFPLIDFDDSVDLEIKNGKWVKFVASKHDVWNRWMYNSIDSQISNKSLELLRSTFQASKTITEFLNSTSFYTIYPDSLREPQRPSNSYPLDEKGQNIASVLRNIKRNKNIDSSDTISEALSKVIEGVDNFSVTQVGGYLVTRLHHTVSAKGRRRPAFELAHESDGTLRMLGILTALYQEPPRSLLTIEEPELTIHPGAMGLLCDVLKEASTRSQVIITTHNPDLIDQFPTDSLRVVEIESGITTIGLVSENQREVIARRLFSPGELMRIEGLRSDVAEAVAE